MKYLIFFLFPFYCWSSEFPYSFVKPPYISPQIIERLCPPWPSCGENEVTTIELWSANAQTEQNDALFIDRGSEGCFPIWFEYSYHGTTDNGIHILWTEDQGGGTGIFKGLLFVVLDVMDDPEQRVVIRRVGDLFLGDRWHGSVTIEGNQLHVEGQFHLDDEWHEATYDLSFPAATPLDPSFLTQNETNQPWDLLPLAVYQSDAEETKRLLEGGAPLTFSHGPPHDLLVEAAGNSDACAEVLLDFQAPVNGCDADGNTPLHLITRNTIVTKRLLDQGADINAQNHAGETALHIAAKGHPKTVFLLLDKGARVDLLDKNEHSPLMAALETYWVDREMINALYEQKSPTQPSREALIRAIEYGHFALVKQLVAQGTPIDGETKWSSPLNRAIDAKKFEIATFLIEQGADVLPTSPLLEAVKQNWLQGAKQLISRGADVHNTSGWGPTLLSIAARNGSVELVKLLVENGADLHEGGWHETPLYAAARTMNVDVLHFLIDHGALEELGGCSVPDPSL